MLVFFWHCQGNTKGGLMNYKEMRKNYSQALSKLEKYDGKFIKKLGQKSIQEINEARQRHDLLMQDIEDAQGKKIDLSGLREQIEACEKCIDIQDKLESCPSFQEVLDAKKVLNEKIKNLESEYGKLAMQDAVRCRAINWHICHY
jgi:hypothetical protein